MQYRASSYLTCHNGMVSTSACIPIQAKRNRNVVLERVAFSMASFFSTKLPKQLFGADLVLNSSLKQFNYGNAFGKNKTFS